MPNVLAMMGAETGDTLEILGPTGSVSASSSQAHSGGWSYRIQGDGSSVNYFKVTGPSTSSGSIINELPLSDDFYITFYLYIASAPGTDEMIVSVDNSANRRKGELRLTSSREIDLWIDNGGTKQEDGSTVLATGQWHRIEFRCGTDSGAGSDDGSYEVKINGTTEYSGTGDMRDDPCYRVFMGNHLRRGSSSFDFYYDDISVADDDFVGKSEIVRMDPDSNGFYTAWTNDYTAADDLESSQPHDGDSTYNLGSGSPTAETHKLEDSDDVGITSGHTIHAVRTFSIVRNGGGSGSVLYYRTRVAGADDDTSTGSDPGGTYNARGKIYNHTGFWGDSGDPDWTTTRLDGIEVGCLWSGMGFVFMRMTACGAMVLHTPPSLARSRFIPHAGI